MNRTSGLSIPMPNAIVATITRPSSRWNRAWWAARVAGVEPCVVGQSVEAAAGEEPAVASTDARDRQYTIPASPACSLRSRSSSWRRGSFFATIR